MTDAPATPRAVELLSRYAGPGRFLTTATGAPRFTTCPTCSNPAICVVEYIGGRGYVEGYYCLVDWIHHNGFTPHSA